MFTLKDLQEYLKEYTDIYVGYETINRWRKKGLLGEVPLRESGTWSDYEPVKERALVITVMRGYGWSERKVRELLSMEVEESKKKLLELIEKLEEKVLPRFKMIVEGKWEKIMGEDTIKKEEVKVEDTKEN